MTKTLRFDSLLILDHYRLSRAFGISAQINNLDQLLSNSLIRILAFEGATITIQKRFELGPGGFEERKSTKIHAIF